MYCPICRYNLRGLAPAALCPECGSTPEQRAAALAQRPRFVIPAIFAVSTAISVGVFFQMSGLSPRPLEVLLFFTINSLPHFFALSILTTFARPRTRTEAALAALPPAITVLAVLSLAYWGLFFPMNNVLILLSPAFAVPPALIACYFSFLIVKRCRRRPDRLSRDS